MAVTRKQESGSRVAAFDAVFAPGPEAGGFEPLLDPDELPGTAHTQAGMSEVAAGRLPRWNLLPIPEPLSFITDPRRFSIGMSDRD